MIRRLFAALLLLGAASMSHAVLVDLKSAAWQVYGTASPSTGSFGDAIGYDRSDSDRDGNPYARWFNSDQGVDYDEAMTATPFTPPMRITFNGCFPATRYGYNRIVVGEKNTAFTNATNAYQYPIKPKFGLTTRWDYAGSIHTFVTRGAYEDVLKAIPQAVASNNQYCGAYGMDWDGQRNIFTYNGTEVDRRTFVSTEPLYILVRSFELPHSYSTMTVDHAGLTGATTTVVLQPAAAGVGSMDGTVGGNVTCTGQAATAVVPSLGAVSSDLRFTNLAGAVHAVVAGRGSIVGTGVSFTYTADFNATTGALTGTFRDSDDTADQPIQFNPAGSGGALAWRALVNGSVNASGRACSYALTVNLALPASAIYSGGYPAGTRFNGPVTRTEPITIPLSIPEFGISRNYSTNIVIEGGWTAQVTPGATGPALNGYMDATFRIDPEISETFTVNIASPVPGITIPPVSIPIQINMAGRITGNLFGNLQDNSVSFRGNWNGNSVGGVQASGQIEMPIPFGPGGVAPAAVQPRITGATVVPIATPATPVPIPGFPASVTVPLDVRPTVPFVLQ